MHTITNSEERFWKPLKRFLWIFVCLAGTAGVLTQFSCAGKGTGLDQNGNPVGPGGGNTGGGGGGPFAPTFAAIQANVFTPICTECHAGPSAPLGLSLEAGKAYNNIVNIASVQKPSLMRVRPFQADSCYLIHKLEGTAGITGARMPRNGPYLAPEVVAVIKQWVNSGALLGENDATPPTVAVTFPNGGESFPADSVVTLTWSASDNKGVASESLYWSPNNGTNWVGLAAVGGSVRSFDWTVPQTATTQGLVHVVAYDSSNNRAFDNSDTPFSIRFLGADVTAPLVGVTFPNGGESLAVNTSKTLTWTAFDNVGVVSESLYYSTDGGTSWAALAPLTGSPVAHNWLVPNLPTQRARLKVVAFDLAGNSGRDSSDADFVIYDPAGGPFAPTFDAIQTNVFTPRCTGCHGGGTPQQGLNLEAGFSYNMLVGLASVEQPQFMRVKPFKPDSSYLIHKLEGAPAISGGRMPFGGPYLTQPEINVIRQWITNGALPPGGADVQAPSVTVTFPNGGESLFVGSTVNFTWLATDNIGVSSESLYYSFNGGASWFGLAVFTGNIQNFSWLVPNSPTAAGRIKVAAFDQANNRGEDQSNLNFVIASPPSGDAQAPVVTVTAPNGGEVSDVGQTLDIRWNATDNVGVAQESVYYSTNAGTTWLPVAGLTGANGRFNWTVPNTPSTTSRVLVAAFDLAGNRGIDVSNANFTIQTPPPMAFPPIFDTIQVRVFTPRCTGCHSGGGAPRGLRLEAGFAYNNLVNIASVEQAQFMRVKPGKPDSSYIIHKLEGRPGISGARMPDGGPYLAQNVINSIRAWIANGAPLAGPGGADTVPPAVSVQFPNGAESLKIGVSATLRWSATDNIGITQESLYVSYNSGGSWSLLAAISGGAQTYGWMVPNNPVLTARLKVVAFDLAGNRGEDQSDADFVLSPSGGSGGPFAPTLSAIQENVFTPRCTRCHSGGSPPEKLNLSAGVAFSNLVNVASKQNDNLMRVKPGAPNISYLIWKLEGHSDIDGDRMPKGGPYLTAEEIAVIRQWIADGAQNNLALAPAKTAGNRAKNISAVRVQP